MKINNLNYYVNTTQSQMNYKISFNKKQGLSNDTVNINTNKNKNSHSSSLNKIGNILLVAVLLLTGCSKSAKPSMGVTRDEILENNKNIEDSEIIQNQDVENENYYGGDVNDTEFGFSSEIEQNFNVESSHSPSEQTSQNVNNEILPEQKLLDTIRENCINGDESLKAFTSELNMTEEEATKYIIDMCESPQFGNNCIAPIHFFGLLAHESKDFTKLIGDYNPLIVANDEIEKYDAIGIGHMHKTAVDEVNNQIANGLYGDYTYNNGNSYAHWDRWDAKKTVEMSLLYLRYCATKTDSYESMMAMYNTGNPNGVNTQKGKEYVSKVYEKVGEVYNPDTLSTQFVG